MSQSYFTSCPSENTVFRQTTTRKNRTEKSRKHLLRRDSHSQKKNCTLPFYPSPNHLTSYNLSSWLVKSTCTILISRKCRTLKTGLLDRSGGTRSLNIFILQVYWMVWQNLHGQIFVCIVPKKLPPPRDLLLRFDQWSSWCQRLVRKRWEGVLAAKATCGWFDAHHLEDARVQSPGVCTQSVMSTVAMRSNLMGRQRTDHGCRKWFRREERKSAGRTRRPSTFKCTWYSCTHTVSALSTQRALPFRIIPVRPMTPTRFELWGINLALWLQY